MIRHSYELPTDLWPHQATGIQATIDAATAGDRRLVLTAPCGAGKTRMMTELIEWGRASGRPAALYTSRRMLFRQTLGVLRASGIEPGLRASGEKPALLWDTQLCMTPTEFSAVYKKKSRTIHNAKIVLVDELHMQKGAMMGQLIEDHYKAGATIVAFTATPLDLEGEWDKLIVAGKNSDLRRCGAHVPAIHYCPDEPDLKFIKKYNVGEDLTDKENAKAIMRPGIFGRVWDNWIRLNPEQKATILFAPDVDGSLYFAKEFHNRGVRAAHIDSKNIWVDGEQIESSDDNRAMLMEQSRDGSLAVLCNRFVLREGIDLPHVACCIMATVFGSLQSYLQSGGRVIRSHPTLEDVTVIDHGGNYVRHGSLNSDRQWELGQSSYVTTGLRTEAMRDKPDLEPIRCPKCGAMRLSGPKCINSDCGYEYQKRSRIVVQVDGELKEMVGPAHRKRRTERNHDTEELWRKMYHRAKSKKWNATFNQARGLFYYENHYYPPADLPMMPTDPHDWYQKVADVPKERLT